MKLLKHKAFRLALGSLWTTEILVPEDVKRGCRNLEPQNLPYIHPPRVFLVSLQESCS